MTRMTEAELRLHQARIKGREEALATLKGNRAEELMWKQLQALQGWERELVFHPGRRWRFDFANQERALALEIDGQVHRIAGRFEGDVDKLNQATLSGWRVLRVTPGMVDDGSALDLVVQAIRTLPAQAVLVDIPQV